MAKKKAKQAAGCTCIDQVNEKLKPYNTYIPRELSINFDTGKSRRVLMIPSAKIDSKVRGRAKTLIAAYCPICGKSLATEVRELLATPPADGECNSPVEDGNIDQDGRRIDNS